MSVFPSKEAELVAYVEHNGWGMEDAVALNMLKQKKFSSEEAAQLLLVSRRTNQRIEAVLFGVATLRAAQSMEAFLRAGGRTK